MAKGFQMRNSSNLLVVLCLVSVSTAGLGLSSAWARESTAPRSSSDRTLTTAQWRSDLDQLTSSLRETHPGLFHRVPEEEFEDSVDTLRAELPELDEHQIVLRMAALLAAVGDGHTRLTLPRDHRSGGPLLGHSTDPEVNIDLGFHQLPLEFDLFDDGLYITRATRAHQALIGAQIRHVGNLDAAAALEAVRPVTYADNEQTFRLLAPDRLTLAEILVGLGITDSADDIPLQVVLPNGEDLSVTVDPISEDKVEWVSHQLAQSMRPVWLEETTEMSRWEYSTPYRIRFLDDDNTVYVQINEIDNDSAKPLAEFMPSAIALAETRAADRFVLDLRKNHGGSGDWNRAILLALLQSEYVNEFGRLYVLTGRRTFSAAIMLVGLLERWTEAIFVGEPTGSALSQFGDPKKFQLDNSGLTVRVSSIFWHSWLAGDPRPSYTPHIVVEYSGRDFFEGHDPVLKAAVGHRVATSTSDRFRQLLEGDLNHAAIWALKQMTAPTASSRELEVALDLAGQKFLDEGRLEMGRYSYLIGLSLFPGSERLEVGLDKIPKTEN